MISLCVVNPAACQKQNGPDCWHFPGETTLDGWMIMMIMMTTITTTSAIPAGEVRTTPFNGCRRGVVYFLAYLYTFAREKLAVLVAKWYGAKWGDERTF